MTIQSEFSAAVSDRAERWLSEEKESAAIKTRVTASVRMQIRKATVSIALLLAVIILIGYYYDPSEILSNIRTLSFGAVCAFFAALFANAFAAVFRFKIIAKEIGHPIGFRRAMAVVSAGTLAGAMFFQIAGQLVARGFIAGQGGIPFAAVVVITAYERFTAAILSALLALGGAVFIFGNIYLDRSAGGADLIKIIVGLIAATAVGALIGYGRMAVQNIAPILTRHFVRRCVTIIGLTLCVHVPMQTAYVIAAHTLAPQIPIADLIAASLIVMFATSVPISLAGWGMREMSAVVGLGAIGVPAHSALTTAVMIGIGSLIVIGTFAAISLPEIKANKLPHQAPTAKTIDYYRVLEWVLPLGAATLVLFQIYVPVQSGLLNVNLADPLAILGGVLFIIRYCRARRPAWRIAHVNLAAILATIVLGISLLLGAERFGWTTWAVTNRFLGWFVLLAYATTGALIVRDAPKEGFRLLLLTFAGATAAIAGVEVFLILLTNAGIRVPVVPNNAEGFSLNHNFFAFQLLMAFAAAISVVRGFSLRLVIFATLLTGLWFAGSRSGWIATLVLLGAALYLRIVNVREISIALACAAGIALFAAILPDVTYKLTGLMVTKNVPAIVPSAASTEERLISIFGGLKLFVEHPIFGAGLGAFRNQMIFGASPQPLLIHSTAVWLLAELGIIGFLVFAISATYAFASEWVHARKEQASALIILCLVAFAVMAGPADMLYQRTFWLLIGAGLAVVRRE
jgi:hypothetical protein